MMKIILWRTGLFLIFAILLILAGLQKSAVAPAHAGEPHSPNDCPVHQGGSDYVYVCAERCTNPNYDFGPIGYDFDNATGTAYSPQVLANEWHGASQAQALRAGAVAIHTFAWRGIGGCGAIQRWRELYSGGPEYRVENNCAQRYWLGTAPDYSCYVPSGQNAISTAHRNAVNDTLYMRVFRSDWEYACAKHFTDCGNPTANSSLEPATLISIPDPVDSDTNLHRPGLSQNGTHAWELSDYAGAAPWDYRQMLSHYYSHVRVPNADYDYRWAWLDVTSDTRFGRYYGPLAHTPTTMLTGIMYDVQMHIQNTGNATWNHSGSNPVLLSYHWYDSSGQNVVAWDGLRTDLGQDMGPTDDVPLNAKVLAPLQPGTYVLKWDMVKEGVTWFSQQQSWPTQSVAVTVVAAPGRAYLPLATKGY